VRRPLRVATPVHHRAVDLVAAPERVHQRREVAVDARAVVRLEMAHDAAVDRVGVTPLVESADRPVPADPGPGHLQHRALLLAGAAGAARGDAFPDDADAELAEQVDDGLGVPVHLVVVEELGVDHVRLADGVGLARVHQGQCGGGCR